MGNRLPTIFIGSFGGRQRNASLQFKMLQLQRFNHRPIDITGSNGLNRVKSFLVSSASTNFCCIFTVDLSIWHRIQALLCQRRDLLLLYNKKKKNPQPFQNFVIIALWSLAKNVQTAGYHETAPTIFNIRYSLRFSAFSPLIPINIGISRHKSIKSNDSSSY